MENRSTEIFFVTFKRPPVIFSLLLLLIGLGHDPPRNGSYWRVMLIVELGRLDVPVKSGYPVKPAK